MRRIFPLLLFPFLAMMATKGAEPVRPVSEHLRIICTTDVHGNYFPYDFIHNVDGEGSLARIYNYVQEERRRYGADNVLLLDAGDILQGQPPAYHSNYVDTTSVHVCADVMNYMGYDAATIGNHDVETGHKVYDRWVGQCRFPILAANVMGCRGEPYWKPYVIVEKGGLRIAVLGLLTPAIPQWLPENLWSGLLFHDMVAAARRYMPEIRREADFVVGLFHSGMGSLPSGTTYFMGDENATQAVARLVPGFDIIFCGHDHRRADTTVVNIEGCEIPVLNAGPSAHFVASATIHTHCPTSACTMRPQVKEETGVRASITHELIDIRGQEPERAFMRHFRKRIKAVKDYSSQKLATNPAPLSSRDAFFGPSPFVDYIHTLQLHLTGADISFAAPLGFDATLPEGILHMGDMFTLYPFENRLYVMRLTGREIKDFLEYSYAGWIRQQAADSVGNAESHLLNFRSTTPLPDPSEHWKLLAVSSFNFDSAAGLRYVVDVTRPPGERVIVECLADGRPFSPDSTYSVALNSYRGNGGGGHLTEGACIPREKLSDRIVWSTPLDLRHYMAEALRRDGTIRARTLDHWRFVPKDIVQPLVQRDRKILFPQDF